jgi:hypothetical protein
MSEVTCKSCRHSFRRLIDLPHWGSGYEWKCRRAYVPEATEFDPVSGPTTTKSHYKSCSSMRLHRDSDQCGRDGQWWEPKNSKDFFVYLKRV